MAGPTFVQLLVVHKHTALPVLTHLQALLAVLDTEAGFKRVNCKTQVGEIGKWCNVKQTKRVVCLLGGLAGQTDSKRRRGAGRPRAAAQTLTQTFNHPGFPAGSAAKNPPAVQETRV